MSQERNTQKKNLHRFVNMQTKNTKYHKNKQQKVNFDNIF